MNERSAYYRVCHKCACWRPRLSAALPPSDRSSMRAPPQPRQCERHRRFVESAPAERPKCTLPRRHRSAGKSPLSNLASLGTRPITRNVAYNALRTVSARFCNPAGFASSCLPVLCLLVRCLRLVWSPLPPCRRQAFFQDTQEKWRSENGGEGTTVLPVAQLEWQCPLKGSFQL